MEETPNNTIALLERVSNAQGLVFALNDILWGLSEVPYSMNREFKSMFALVESLEQSITAIKNIIEQAVEID